VKDNFFDLHARSGTHQDVPLSKYRGKAVLVVNTASACGFTPQYADLEALHQRYHARGLVVLAFPCDQFGHQEPGDDAAIAEFCQVNFGVSFPLMEKTEVNGRAAHPVFQFLKRRAPGVLVRAIKWNFTKFLVSPDGEAVQRFAPAANPLDIAVHIEKLVPASSPAAGAAE
jgi:glutathione peroxidase